MTKKGLSTKRSHGFIVKVCTQAGQLTGHKLLAPYNSPAKFSIGSLEFIVKNSSFAYAQGDIPASWFIDLNAADQLAA